MLLLGDLGINIAGMQVGRDVKGGMALTALTVDSAITPDVLEAITGAIGADMARRVDLAD
jgi:D-3-phosphoglycerate dehydrogenase